MCAGGGGVAAAVTNMKKKGTGLYIFWESLAHQWAADYFLVRMVVPGTKPVENPCTNGSTQPLMLLHH